MHPTYDILFIYLIFELKNYIKRYQYMICIPRSLYLVDPANIFFQRYRRIVLAVRGVRCHHGVFPATPDVRYHPVRLRARHRYFHRLRHPLQTSTGIVGCECERFVCRRKAEDACAHLH